MAAKFVFAIVVALCFVQGLQSMHLPESHHRNIIDEIIEKALEEARKVIHDVTQKVKAAIEKGQDAVDAAVSLISSGLHTIVEKEIAVVETLAEKLVAQIEKLLEDAANNGINVAECAKGKVEAAQNIKETAIADIQNCVTTAEASGETIKTAFHQMVADVEQQLDNMEKEVLSCIPEHGDHTLEEAKKIAKCLADEAVHIHQQDKELLSKIAHEVVVAEEAAKEALKEGTSCIQQAVANAFSKEKALIQEVKDCIAGAQ